MTSRITVKFLDPREIDQAIREVAEETERERIPVALAGGAAMQLYGSDRMTKDVDFLSTAVPNTITVERTLSFGGVAGRTRSNLPVDFIVRDDDYQPLYEAAIDRAVRVEGVPVPVVTPEYLAAMKLSARRVKDEEDLRTLIRNNVLDLKAARLIIREHLGRYAVDEFDSYVDEVEWLRSRGKE